MYAQGHIIFFWYYTNLRCLLHGLWAPTLPCSYMKPSLDKSRASVSCPAVPEHVPEYSFYEYHWDGPKRLHVPLWQPRQTTLVVVFEGESRHCFSTVHILLYYSKGSPKLPKGTRSDTWVRLVGEQDLSSRIHLVTLHRTFNNRDQWFIRLEARFKTHVLTRLLSRSSRSRSKLHSVTRLPTRPVSIPLSFAPQQVPRSFAANLSMFCSNTSSC